MGQQSDKTPDWFPPVNGELQPNPGLVQDLDGTWHMQQELPPEALAAARAREERAPW